MTCKSEHIRKGFELELHLPEADGSDKEEFNEFRGNIGNQFEVFVFEASWLKLANTQLGLEIQPLNDFDFDTCTVHNLLVISSPFL